MSWLSKWKPLQSLVGGAEGLLAGGPVGAAVGFGGNMLGQGMKGGGGGIWSENLPAGSTGGAMGKTGNLLNYIIPAFQAYKAYQSNKQLEDLQRQIMAKLAGGPGNAFTPKEQSQVTDAGNLAVNDTSNRQFNDAYSSLGSRGALGNTSIAGNTAMGLSSAQSMMKAQMVMDMMLKGKQLGLEDYNAYLGHALGLLGGQREDASAAGTGLEATLRNIFAAKAYDPTAPKPLGTSDQGIFGAYAGGLGR